MRGVPACKQDVDRDAPGLSRHSIVILDVRCIQINCTKVAKLRRRHAGRKIEGPKLQTDPPPCQTKPAKVPNLSADMQHIRA